jgi:hypothetical protein
VSLLATPWLSYGCSIGARLRTSGGYATVVKVREDDSCELAYDGVHDKNSKKPEIVVARPGQELHVDPRPDTVARTSSPSYKAGQVLMLVHEKRLVDATVEHWFGLTHGSRHRVKIGPKGGAAAQRSKKDAAKNVMELDLNEENHAKLLMSSVAKYENSRTQYAPRPLTLRKPTARPLPCPHPSTSDASWSHRRRFLSSPWVASTLAAQAPRGDAVRIRFRVRRRRQAGRQGG